LFISFADLSIISTALICYPALGPQGCY